jgi:plastocyanin
MTLSVRFIRRLPTRAAAGLVLASLVLGACSAAATPGTARTAAPTSRSSGADTFQIKNTAFPPTITVTAGTTVTWANADVEPHTVTADDGSFDSGDVAAGSTFQHTFATAGTVTYHCIIHEQMKGTVIVTPASS